MYDRSVFDVDDAIKLIDASLAAVRDAESPISIAVVDDVGDWVAFARMDRAPYFDREHARRKAYTAAVMREDLHALAAARVKTGQLLTDLGNSHLIGSAHGGVAVRDSDGHIIGGLGISGASPEEDERIARSALAEAPVQATGDQA